MKAAQWLATLTTLFHATDQTHGGQVCPKRGLAEELLQTPPGVSSSIGFPTSNSLHEANVPRIKAALTSPGAPVPPEPLSVKALVSFYYSANCPYSAAFRPVLECLPKFFPTSLRFIAIDHAQLPTTLQLNHGVLSTPVVRVSVKACTARDLALGIAVSQNMKVSLLQGKRARYLGPPRLGELIYFVEKQSGVQAVGSVSDIDACGRLPACACTREARPVTPGDIATLGWNRWLLVSLAFLVIAAGQLVYSAKKQRDLGEETAPADRLHELMHGWI